MANNDSFNDSLDEMRRQIQNSLINSKREILREEYGMLAEYTHPQLPAEIENEGLDYILEFERQFAQAEDITVRARLGNPHIVPLAEIPVAELETAVDHLLDLLAAQNIAIHFLGNWEIAAIYRYLTEELLDEEIADIRIEGMFTTFTPCTPEYDIEMWIEEFVSNFLTQEQKYFLKSLEQQPFYDRAGHPLSDTEFIQQVKDVWSQIPPASHRPNIEPTSITVTPDGAEATAVITWRENDQPRQIQSFFRLQPSPYTGWDIIFTTLLDDLLRPHPPTQ